MDKRNFLGSLAALAATASPSITAPRSQFAADDSVTGGAEFNEKRQESLLFVDTPWSRYAAQTASFVCWTEHVALNRSIGVGHRHLCASGPTNFGPTLLSFREEWERNPIYAVILIAKEGDPEVAACEDLLSEYDRGLIVIESALVDLAESRFPAEHPVVAVQTGARVTVRVPSIWGTHLMELWNNRLHSVGIEDIYRIGSAYIHREQDMLAELAAIVGSRLWNASDPHADLLSGHVAVMITERDQEGEIARIRFNAVA